GGRVGGHGDAHQHRRSHRQGGDALDERGRIGGGDGGGVGGDARGQPATRDRRHRGARRGPHRRRGQVLGAQVAVVAGGGELNGVARRHGGRVGGHGDAHQHRRSHRQGGDALDERGRIGGGDGGG